MKRLLMVATISRFFRDFLLPYAEHFRAQGWQVDGMANGTSIYPECHDAFDQLWEIEWSRNPLDPHNLTKAVRALNKLVRQEKYDIVHVHTPVAAFATRYALRNLRQNGTPKVIYTAHGFHFHPLGNPMKNCIFLSLEKIAGFWTDYLVVMNDYDDKAAHRYHFVRPDRVCYMPGIGVDTMALDPARIDKNDVGNVRRELGLSSEDKLFLMIAEFNPGKHHQYALDALSLLHMPNVHLALAGEGPLLDEMKLFAVKAGIADRIHFLGFRRDIPFLIRAAVATVLPSEREGLPKSVIESLSLEVPVIGTRIRGIRDLLNDQCGILVSLEKPLEMANAMRWMIDNPTTAQQMGKAGRKRVQNCDVRRIIRMHEQLYDHALTEEPVIISHAA